MTFYEAALRVLEEAGAPLHYLEITKRSLDKGLLSHIGKMPEHTMLARLAAQAKRSRERKLVVTSRDTFALSDWMLDEDADALAITGTIEPNAEEGLPPYRTNERHPEPRAEYLRAIGRQAERNRRDRRDDEGKRKKFPPVPEVAFEVLQEAGALVPSELIARLKARDLVDDLGTLALLEALADDNQQRIDQGRRPQFAALRTETNELQLSVDATSPESAPLPLQAQEAFCKAANLPFENGRVVLRSQRRRDEAPATVAPTPEDLALVQTAKGTVKDARRAMARVLRRKLSELETGTFEKACVKLLHAHGFRELKVARRAKDGALLSARKKEGSLELRFAIRMLRGGAAVERRQVQELRRDVSQVSANLGLLLTPGEARGDARAEGTSGGALVMLWCGEHLADKFFEGEVGVSVTRVELFDIDEAFFEQAKLDAEEASKRREERQKDRDGRRDGDDERPPPDARRDEAPADDAPSEAPAAAAAAADTAPVDGDEGDDEGDEEEGDEGEGAEAGAPGDAAGAQREGGRRRRRRRRRRRGGAGRPDGAPAQTAGEGGAPSPAPATEAAPPPPAAPASSGSGEPS
jgi:ribonuclease E